MLKFLRNMMLIVLMVTIYGCGNETLLKQGMTKIGNPEDPTIEEGVQVFLEENPRWEGSIDDEIICPDFDLHFSNVSEQRGHAQFFDKGILCWEEDFIYQLKLNHVEATLGQGDVILKATLENYVFDIQWARKVLDNGWLRRITALHLTYVDDPTKEEGVSSIVSQWLDTFDSESDSQESEEMVADEDETEHKRYNAPISLPKIDWTRERPRRVTRKITHLPVREFGAYAP